MLSKSNLLKGWRCPKYLFLSQISCELPDLDAQRRMEEGRQVGIKAREYFGKGVLIDELDPGKAVQKTNEAIKEGALTIFEGAIVADDLLVRPDILQRDSLDSPWMLYEVKATNWKKTKKPQKIEYTRDIAFQYYVLQEARWDVQRAYLTHLNPECVFPHLENLFVHEDLTEEIKSYLEEIPHQVTSLNRVLANSLEPCVNLDSYCLSPRKCPYKHYCWQNESKKSVLTLWNFRSRWKYYKKGIKTIDELNLEELKDPHPRIITSVLDNRRIIESRIIKEKIEKWHYPLISLDFEALAPAIPLYEGMSPYDPIPFQFSCHIKDHPKTELRHYEYLHENKSDPRPFLLENLLKSIPEEGTLLAYNAKYEKRIIKKLAAFSPDHSEELMKFHDRFQDPLNVFTKTVYDPAFQSSFSLKKVAPVLLGEEKGYSGLEVSAGMEAVAEYERFIEMASSEEKDKLKQHLLDYCRQDTAVLLDLVLWLFQQSEQAQ